MAISGERRERICAGRSARGEAGEAPRALRACRAALRGAEIGPRPVALRAAARAQLAEDEPAPRRAEGAADGVPPHAPSRAQRVVAERVVTPPGGRGRVRIAAGEDG